MKVRLHRVFGHAEQRRHLRHALSHPVMQPQAGLVDLRQFVHAFRQGLLPPRSLKPFPWIHQRRGRLRERVIAHVRGLIADPRFQVACLVKADAIDPGAELRVASKAVEPVVNSQKDFLRYLLSIGSKAGTQYRDHQAEHFLAVAADQLCESVLITAGTAAVDERFVSIHGSPSVSVQRSRFPARK